MKKTVFLVVLAAFVFSVVGFAHAVENPASAPPVSVPRWDGLYGGLRTGYVDQNLTENDYGYSNTITTNMPSLQGGEAGAAFGYNKTFGGLVLGAEADIHYAPGTEKTETCLGCGGTSGVYMYTHKVQRDGYATARLRAGLPVQRGLIYVTGGLAGLAQTGSAYSNPANFDSNFGNPSKSSILLGWTAGMGVEYAVSDNWSLTGQYLYMHFPEQNFGIDTDNSLNNPQYYATSMSALTLGVNYKLGVATSSASDTLSYADPATHTWDGFYGGLRTGFVDQNLNENDYGYYDTITTNMPSLQGGEVGAALGYNKTFDGLVLGAEADIHYAPGTEKTGTGLNGTNPGNYQYTYKVQRDGYATARLKAGLPVQRALFYVTGGLAGLMQNGSAYSNPESFDSSFGTPGKTSLLLGWAAGAGIEYAVSDKWSLTGQYLYMQFPTQHFGNANNGGAFSGQVFPQAYETSISALTLGANYKFYASDAPYASDSRPHIWDGFYGGIRTGFVDQNLNENDYGYSDTITTNMPSLRGGEGGVALGYNKTFGGLVLGAEADIHYAPATESLLTCTPCGSPDPAYYRYTYKVQRDGYATARLRAGLPVQRALLYVTGGLAGMEQTGSAYSNPGTNFDTQYGTPSKTSILFGWTAGMGIEYAVSDKWSLTGQYLYMQFPHQNFGNAGPYGGVLFPQSYDTSMSALTIGVNYSF